MLFSIFVVFCLYFYLILFECEQVGENDTKPRWYSILNSEKSGSVNQLNLKRDLFLGKRYESTAAESNATSSPPAEKFEYQAEVLPSFVCAWSVASSAIVNILWYICFGRLVGSWTSLLTVYTVTRKCFSGNLLGMFHHYSRCFCIFFCLSWNHFGRNRNCSIAWWYQV